MLRSIGFPVAAMLASLAACSPSDVGDGADPATVSAPLSAPLRLDGSSPRSSSDRKCDQDSTPLERPYVNPSSSPGFVGREHPGHTVNKVEAKAAAPAAGSPLPGRIATPVDHERRQREYLQRWAALQPSLAALPAADQDLKRAELKREAMGF
jgi:hypothetical protein